MSTKQKCKRNNTQDTASTYQTAGFFVPSKVETTKLIKPANYNQRQYVKSMLQNTVTIATGAAGVGKSLLALHTATCLMNHHDSPIERIVYIRGNVGIQDEDKLGSLPGEISDKVTHLAYPIMDNLSEFMQKGQINALFDFEKITVLPVSLVRGRSLANTFIILDEAQNVTMHGIRSVLTRISHGSKIAIFGDSSQSDLRDYSGCLDITADRLEMLEDVGVVRFTLDDIVRHPILKDLIKALDEC